MQTIYRPGNWLLVAADGAFVVLPPQTSGELITALWERLPRERSLGAVIDALTGGGGSFTALPSFAAAVLDGANARVAVRGPLAVRVSGADAAAEVFSGAEVTTWSERFVAGVTKIEVTAEDADSTTTLPIGSGIVLVSAVSATVDGTASSPSTGSGQAAGTHEASVEAPSWVAEPVEASQVPAESPSTAEPVEASGTQEAAAEPEASEVPEATLVPSEATFAPVPDEFDHLWGATVHTPIEEAAVRPTPEPTTEATAEPIGDHDGATISAAELRALRQQPAPPAASEAPTVVIPVADVPSGRMQVSTGQVVNLDRTVIIGRRPRSTRASGASLPLLIAVDSPQQDISRNHLEVRPEGDTVVVIDLHTTNGSTLLRPGADPVRLHPGEQTLVLSGDVVDLGDGVTVAFEDLP